VKFLPLDPAADLAGQALAVAGGYAGATA
jgi:hypothetical protein